MEDVISNNTQQDSQEQSGSDAKSGGDSESQMRTNTLEAIMPKIEGSDQIA